MALLPDDLQPAFADLKIDPDVLVSMRDGSAAATALNQDQYILERAKSEVEAAGVIDVDSAQPHGAATLERRVELLEHLRRIQKSRRSAFLQEHWKELMAQYNPLQDAYSEISAGRPHAIADDGWEV